MRLSVPISSLVLLAACGGAPTVASLGPTKVDLPIAPAPSAKRPSAALRESPPPSGAAKESPFPKVARQTLPSGLSVAVVEAHALPIVQLRVVIHAGMGYGGTPGAAELTGQMLKDGGTRSMTSAELLRRIETLGTDLSVRTDFDATVLSMAVTKEHALEALGLLAEVVQAPRFDEAELKKLKSRESDEARDNARSHGTWMATRAVFRELYTQANPYSTYDLLPGEIARIQPATVKDFHRRFYVPKNVTVILAGDVDPKSAREAAEKAFGGWKGADPPKVEFPAAIRPTRRHVIVAHRPKSVQSDAFVALLVPPRQTPDWPRIRVANQILGGGVASRLFTDVREQRSLAYSTNSRVIELSHGEEPLVLYAGTESSKTPLAVQGLLENLEKIAREPVSAQETETARRYLSDIFAIRMETIGSIADMVASQETLGLPDGYWDTYRAQVRATDAAAASATAHGLFGSTAALIVVAGDADVIALPLSRFGEVTVVDPEHDFQTIKTIPFQAEKERTGADLTK